MDRLRIKTDLAFKCIFGRDIRECKEALKNLLSAILEISIEDIVYRNPYNIAEHDEDKSSEFDISVDTGKYWLDIEMQMNNMAAFPERMVYYGARLLSSTIEKGNEYTELKKSIVIGILDFKLIKDNENFYNEFCFMEKNTKIVLSQILSIITLEMVKLRDNKPVKDMTPIERWLMYLKYVGEKGHEKLIEEIIEESEGIKMADRVLIQVSADERMRSKLLSQEKFERDSLAKLSFARNEGWTEGRNDGLLEGTVKTMLKLRCSVDDIEKMLKEDYKIDAEKARKLIEEIQDKQNVAS